MSEPSRFSRVNVALVQMRCQAAKEANVALALARIAEAAAAGAQVVCLPELFAGPYFCQSEEHSLFDLAEPIPGPTSQALSAAARDQGVVVIGSLFERRAPGLYHNTAVVFDSDGRQAGMYRKMHIPDDPRYYEKFYFTPGDLGFQSIATRFGRLGVCVCWDQWFPEAARLTAMKGAQILFYPTAIGWHPREKAEFGVGQHEAWETMMRSHAIANGVFVAAVNRIGYEAGPPARDGEAEPTGIEFWGASFVASPRGEIMHRSPHDREELPIVECQLDEIDVVRTHWPFLRDRRIDAYADLAQRYLDR